jgi:hypothetical protein
MGRFLRRAWASLVYLLAAIPIVVVLFVASRFVVGLITEIDLKMLSRAAETRLGGAESVTVPLHEVFPGDWDQCCMIGAYALPASTARKMGVAGWWKLPLLPRVHDGESTIAFVRDGSITEWATEAGGALSTFYMENNQAPYARDTLVVLRRFKGSSSVTMHLPNDPWIAELYGDQLREKR